MALATISNAREVIEVLISAVSMLGGFMAVRSGWAASKSVATGEDPGLVAQHINEGLAYGFDYGLPSALIVFILLAFS